MKIDWVRPSFVKQFYRPCKLQVTSCNHCIGTVVIPLLQTLGSKSVNFYPILMIEGSIWGFLGVLNPFLSSNGQISKFVRAFWRFMGLYLWVYRTLGFILDYLARTESQNFVYMIIMYPEVWAMDPILHIFVEFFYPIARAWEMS